MAVRQIKLNLKKFLDELKKEAVIDIEKIRKQFDVLLKRQIQSSTQKMYNVITKINKENEEVITEIKKELTLLNEKPISSPEQLTILENRIQSQINAIPKFQMSEVETLIADVCEELLKIIDIPKVTK